MVGSDRQRSSSVQDIIERATRLVSHGLNPRPDFERPSFREALLGVAGDGGAINGRRLSKWIGSNESRIVGSLRVVRKGMYRGFMTWNMERVAARGGEG